MGAAGSTQTPDRISVGISSSSSTDKEIEPNSSCKLTRKATDSSVISEDRSSQPKGVEDAAASPQKKKQKQKRKSFEDNMNQFNKSVTSNHKFVSNAHRDAKADSAIIVNNFMTQQVANVSQKVAKIAPQVDTPQFIFCPSLSSSALDTDTTSPITSPAGLISKSLKTGNKLPSASSSLTLRGMAKRHHSRQHNAYINSNSLVQVSSFLNSFSSNSKPSAPPEGTGSGASLSSKKSSSMSSKGSMKLNKITELEDKASTATASSPTTTTAVAVAEKKRHGLSGMSGIALPPPLKLEVVPAAAPPVNNMKKKFGLNLKIHVNDDEEDWIQISDDEDDFALTPRQPKDSKLGNKNMHTHGGGGGNNHHHGQSYTMTQSGTIFVNGFCEGIGKRGIVDKDAESSKLPMRERLVMLYKLGQGCSSIVFKALDLAEMRLVALKMVPVYERDKRRQMVRELSALFQVLRKKQVATEYNQSCMHVSLLFELKKANHQSKKLSVKASKKKKKQSSSSQSLASMDMDLDAQNFKIYPQEYIVDFYDAFSNVEEGGVGLMMEYMDGGSLQDIADAGGCADEGVIANIAVQALAGLDFLHACHQIHRDVKPANLLINLNGDVKVSDLGILRQIDIDNDIKEETKKEDNSKNPSAGTPSTIHRANTFVGTTTYMSPERIDGQEYSYPCDIWSFGLSLLTLSLGRFPLDTKGGFWGLLHSVRDSPPPTLPQEGPWSDEYRDFLSQCLHHNPSDRGTSTQLLQHPFLSQAKAEDPDILADGPIEELEAIVNGIYTHLKSIKNEMNAEHNTSATISVKKKYNVLSIYEMCHRLLFGEASEESGAKHHLHTDVSTASAGADRTHTAHSERLSTLAHQLHMDVGLATEVARDALEALRKKDIDNPDWDSATPKAVHYQVQ